MLRPKSTIAFVPREAFSTTQRTLETLFERTTKPFHLVCVDGGSPPHVQSYLEQAADQRGFTLLRTEPYLTPNQARNLALPYVKTPYVVFVDNDAIVSPDWLRPLEKCAEETGAWVVGPLYFEQQPERHRLHMAGGTCRVEVDELGRRHVRERHHHAHQVYREISERIERHETELIEFHTVLIAMAAFQRLGPLDEGLLNHGEHADLCMSVRQAGHKVFLEPHSRVTYVPPQKLEATDREYFFLRWSEAWATASTQRLIEKWNLSPDHPEFDVMLDWVREHRRCGSALFARLQKLMGRKFARSLQKRLLNRLETLQNRLHYPLKRFSEPTTPQVKVVCPSGAKLPQAA